MMAVHCFRETTRDGMICCKKRIHRFRLFGFANQAPGHSQ